jgi:GNAT superfamily N-acetyltransferase
MLSIDRESSRADRKAFIEFPYRLNRDLPGWVPPLRVGEADQMNRKKNPFFQHAKVEHFLARRSGRVVGRIAACENMAHNETYGDRLGFFGYFDFEDDPEVVEGLVRAARAWLAERRLQRMRGPACYSTNDTCGALIDGFERRPSILMPYNAPYYDARIKETGLEKAKDLLAFSISREGNVPDRFRRVIERRVARSKLRLRPIDLKNLGNDIGTLLDVYNRCWADNWGFVPATAAEFHHAAKQMVPVLEPNMSCVAELDGKPVGLSLILRDLNMLLPGTDGRLWRALPRLLFQLKKVKEMRIIALGVVPERRGRGILEALFLKSVDEGLARGYGPGEAGWILEDNTLMQSPILAVGGQITKRYRIYEMDL